MRRFFTAFLAGLLVGLLPGLVWAARGASFGEPFPGSPNFQSPVEQQTPGGATQPDQSLWVTNPTLPFDGFNTCAWDPDDQITWRVTAKASGAQSWSMCVFADWSPHLLWVDASDGIDAIITVNGVSSDRCLVGPEYDHDAALPVVAGSNGGTAARHVATVTATRAKNGKAGLVLFGFHLPLSDTLNARCGRSDWSSWPRTGTFPGPFVWAVP